MCSVEDYKQVIERRKVSLGDLLASHRVSDSLYNGALTKMCSELNADSCCDRNWKGLSSHLFQPLPDKNIIDCWSKHQSPAYEMLCTWVDEHDERASFSALLDAMVVNESYSSADELLCYFESLEIEMVEGTVVDQPNGEVEQKEKTTTTSPKLAKRSNSLVRLKNSLVKKFKRSYSYPPVNGDQHNTNSPGLDQPLIKRNINKDEIFIVCSNQDYQSESMKNLKSFVRRLKTVQAGNWRVTTIYDLPAGPITTSWLTERVERAAYVIVCCSNTIKQIADSGIYQNTTLSAQSEYNLKFAIDFLITGRIYLDKCVNVAGKFLPILMPGNDFSCVLHLLACFKVFSWPEDSKSIGNYIMGKSERPMPVLGTRKQLVSTRLC